MYIYKKIALLFFSSSTKHKPLICYGCIFSTYLHVILPVSLLWTNKV